MKQFQLLGLLLCLPVMVQAQRLQKNSFQLNTVATRPVSNSIGEIVIENDVLWVGTGRGLMKSTDDGETWTIYDVASGIGRGGVSALAVDGETVWVATSIDTLTDQGRLDAGMGLAVTHNGGDTWKYIPQPVDSPDETAFAPTTVVINNITFDIALTDEAVWIVSFAGGLRRSTDDGETWEIVTVDGHPFDTLGRLSHRLFSVHDDGEALWAGSAAGVHKSTDGGETWTTFNHSNQDQPISGNFVVAIASQVIGGRKRLWAATIEALGAGEYRAASYTDDAGLTWQVTLQGEFPHNFAFDPDTDAAFAATDNGLMRSQNASDWAAYDHIVDTEKDVEMLARKTFCAASDGFSLYIGSGDGMARTRDNGLSWTVFRAWAAPGVDGEPEIYAYPNPFSPTRHNVNGDQGHVRFQYRCTSDCTVDLKVYDFSMALVATVAIDRHRTAGEWAEIWNGRNDLGEMVANGVYYYKIDRSGHKAAWGKVMVLN